MKQHLFYTKTSRLSEFGKNKPQIYQDTSMSFTQEQYSVIGITDINISHDTTNALCTTIIQCALTNLLFYPLHMVHFAFFMLYLFNDS